MMRYIRAFFTALRLTLKGETPPSLRYQPLLDWLETTHKHANAVLKTADQAGLTVAKRKAHTVVVDGRTQSMETIVQAVIYHCGEEYPYMLQHTTPHTITAIYASNLNDQHLVRGLADSLEEIAQSDPALTPVQKAVSELQRQLDRIPPSTSLNNPPS